MKLRITHKDQQGFTLLEAMVALVVFSVGLLGLGALQLAGMGNNQAAMQQSIATHLAYDMAERIRSNAAGRKANLYDDFTALPNNPNLCTMTEGCTPARVATTDNFQWQTDISNMLFGGRGQVQGDGTEFTITVRWDPARSGAAGLNCDPSDQNDLKCLSIYVRP